jgi:hypothetical protein
MQVSLQIPCVKYLVVACTELADTFPLPVHSCKTHLMYVPMCSEILFVLHHRLRLQFEGAHQRAYHLPYTQCKPAQLC